MKKLSALILVAVMLCSVLPLYVFAEDGTAEEPLWSDYVASVQVLDLDQLVFERHFDQNGAPVFDNWYLPAKLQFTMKDGGVKMIEIDTSVMQSAEDEVEFVVNVAPGVDLTFVTFFMYLRSVDAVAYGISQKTGEGEDADYSEVFSDYIELNPEANGTNSIFGRIIAFLKFLFSSLEVLFSMLFSR